MSLSIIGCVVNGPGGDDRCRLWAVAWCGGLLGGKQDHKISNDDMVDHIVELVENAAEIEAETEAAE